MFTVAQLEFESSAGGHRFMIKPGLDDNLDASKFLTVVF